MTGAPRVSVVVPVHDVLRYLDDCLESIVSQSERDLEIVLVNDGSSDGSEGLCDRWAARDPRVRVIHQTKQGSSVARNVGIDAARGQYLTFVDSDDILSPDLVRGLLVAARQTGADIALGELVQFPDGGVPEFATGTTITESSADDVLFQIICVRPQWGPVAKLFRSELFDDGPRFPEGLVHQDLAFTPRIFQRAQRCARTDAVLYGYRQRTGSVSDTSRRFALSPDLITILRSNIEFARATEPHIVFEQYLGSYLRHARRYLERLEPVEAWRRNTAFVLAYRALAGDYRREMARSRSIPPAERAATALSTVAPRPYVIGAGAARRMKAGVRQAGRPRHH